MTWYESAIFIAPNEISTEFLKSHPVFKNNSYVLPAEMEYEVNGQADICMLGDKGLQVIRPFCGPEDHCAGWFDEDYIDWNNFDAKETVIAPINICTANNEIEPEHLPPVGFLAMFKKLARDIDTNLVFFDSFMWEEIQNWSSRVFLEKEKKYF